VKRPPFSLVAGSLLLILCALLAYWPAVHGGFVWEDVQNVSDNPLIKAADGLRQFWFTTEFTDYYALSNTSLWLEWRLWGNRPSGYHVSSILLHALNSILLWRLLRRLNVPGAWWAGMAFALHPVNVMSVAWISERTNLLALFFGLLTVRAYLRWDDSRRRGWYATALISFALALLSKTAIAPLPFVLVLLMRWRHRRIETRHWLEAAPFLGMALVLGLVTIWFEQRPGVNAEAIQSAGFPARLAKAGWAVWFYFGKAIVPVNLCAVYPRWQIPANTVVAFLPLGGLALVAALFWFFRSDWGRAPLVAFVYFVTMLLPELGFVNTGFLAYADVADHWQYFAIIGPIALGCVLGVKIEQHWRWYWMPAAAALALFGLGYATRQQVQVWHSDVSLWSDTIQKNPGTWIAHNNLANAMLAEGKYEDAIAGYRETLQLRPDYAAAHYYLGAALVNTGQTNEAIAELKAASNLAPNWAEPRVNLKQLGVAE
jgi:hypothetical protein